MRVRVSARVVGRLRDATAARKVAGMPLDDAPVLYGQGDFLAVVGSDVTYFQAAHIGDYDLHLELSKLAAGGQPRLLAQPYSPRPRLGRESTDGQKSFQWREGGVDLSDEASNNELADDASEVSKR